LKQREGEIGEDLDSDLGKAGVSGCMTLVEGPAGTPPPPEVPLTGHFSVFNHILLRPNVRRPCPRCRQTMYA